MTRTTEQKLRIWGGPVALSAAFAGLAFWSWARWSHPFIDFGNDLYIPWQLTEGQALYRDIAYRNGPLAPYTNALWFVLFGVSLQTIVWCNLAIFGLICALSYRLMLVTWDVLTATFVGLVLLGVFGFSQYVAIGNYNYVTPYQQSQTHAVVLSLAMLWAWTNTLRTGAVIHSAAAGLLLGLVGLTKAELFVPALAVAVLAVAFLLLVSPRLPIRKRLVSTAVFAVAACVPVVAGYGLLRTQVSHSWALQGVLGNWLYLGEGLLDDPFYRWGSGVDRPGENLVQMLRSVAAIAGFGFAVVALAAAWPGRAAWAARLHWSLLPGALIFVAGVVLYREVPWLLLARALPLTSLAATLLFTGLAWRRRSDASEFLRWATFALFSVWGLALLGKMLLNARFGQYGFVLAMPATLTLVAVLIGGLSSIHIRGAPRSLVQGLTAAAVAAGIVFCVRVSNAMYERKTVRIERGLDSIQALPVWGLPVNAGLDRLERLMPREATLLVLPEGISFNYWLRRSNPSRYRLFLPSDFPIFGGEDAMLADLRAHPPDFVVVVDRDVSEFGVAAFGVDDRYGKRIRDWLDERYERVSRIESPSGARIASGMVILRLRNGDSGR